MIRPYRWILAWLILAGLLAGPLPAAAVVGGGVAGLLVPLVVDNDTRIDVNNIDMFVTNSGGFGRDLESQGGPSGTFFPRGTNKAAVYACGLWFGSKAEGEVRVTVAEYDLEYQPGRIYNEGSTITYDNPADARLRVYKIVKGDTQSEDYLNWPIADGAPVDAEGRPLFVGDQTLWAVYNDADPSGHTNNAGATAPQNIEIQQTTFAFDRPAPLGNMVFVKFKIINRGNETLEDCFISLWSDPDLGGADDDLVGCDTLLSLGYCYNDTNDDEIYESAPPAVGFDFFQGPIVPSPGDTAYVSGRAVPDYRNLPMTSFNKYINGTDPRSASQSYNYMLGLDPLGGQQIDPTTNLPTRYMVAGDPVAGTGWLDTNAADRRLMLSSGPFSMAPGDSQEVVAGLIIAQGADRLESLELLKLYDEQAQAVFDINFQLPSSPPRPQMYYLPGDRSVDLIWSTDALGHVDLSEELDQEYHHQGYNLYQGESVAGPWHKIYTWDVADAVALIYGDVFDIGAGGTQRVIVQRGSDSGLTHKITIAQDAIKGGQLVNYLDYFFAVTSYSYDVRNIEPFFVGENQLGWISPTLENSPQGVTVTPKASSGLLRLPSSEIVRMSGTSDGSVEVVFIDPSLVENAEYDVTFREVVEIEDEHEVTKVVWDLVRSGSEDTLLARQEFQSPDPEEYGYPIVNGMMVRVLGPAPGFKRNQREPSRPMMDEIIHGDGLGGGTPVEPDAWGGPGNDLWWSYNSTADWGLSCGGGDGGEGRLMRDGTLNANHTANDIIMKWDYDFVNNWGWWWLDDARWRPLPFGLYWVDPLTQEEVRLVPLIVEGGASPNEFDFPEDNVDGHYGERATDWIYANTLGEGFTWEQVVAEVSDGEWGQNPTGVELFARLVVWSDADPLQMPPDGTVIKFSTTKPNTPADKFRFRTYAAGDRAGDVVGYDLSRIRAVPNPYLNQSAYELDQFNRVVRFINLPNVPTTIRLFNLAGELIRTLEKEGAEDQVSSILEWDLQNEQAIPVASGIYIFHVDAKGVGAHVGKLAVFVEKERLNRF
ncbi:MAG: hypothetical protein FJY88_00585 [Candidatus Eisenbacteria bacterium]|nr:hypothetical protein [Candidatus Eisenbacteria bacterium]